MWSSAWKKMQTRSKSNLTHFFGYQFFFFIFCISLFFLRKVNLKKVKTLRWFERLTGSGTSRGHDARMVAGWVELAAGTGEGRVARSGSRRRGRLAKQRWWQASRIWAARGCFGRARGGIRSSKDVRRQRLRFTWNWDVTGLATARGGFGLAQGRTLLGSGLERRDVFGKGLRTSDGSGCGSGPLVLMNWRFLKNYFCKYKNTMSHFVNTKYSAMFWPS